MLFFKKKNSRDIKISQIQAKHNDTSASWKYDDTSTSWKYHVSPEFLSEKEKFLNRHKENEQRKLEKLKKEKTALCSAKDLIKHELINRFAIKDEIKIQKLDQFLCSQDVDGYKYLETYLFNNDYQDKQHQVELDNIMSRLFSNKTCDDCTDMNIKQIISGYDYENYIADYLTINGYKNVDTTPKSGDYGADILCISPNNIKTCVQCKYYSNPVPVKAVQEVYSAKSYYACNDAFVFSSSGFTEPCKNMAKKLNVKLITLLPLEDML